MIQRCRHTRWFIDAVSEGTGCSREMVENAMLNLFTHQWLSDDGIPSSSEQGAVEAAVRRRSAKLMSVWARHDHE